MLCIGRGDATEEDWRSAADVVRSVGLLRAETEMEGSRPWKEICAAVGDSGLDAFVQALADKKGARYGRRITQEVGGHTRDRDRSGPATVVACSDPKEGACVLSSGESKKLDGYLGRGKSQDIPLEKLRFLTEAAGSTVTSLQQGGRDLEPVSFGTTGKEYVSDVRGVVQGELASDGTRSCTSQTHDTTAWKRRQFLPRSFRSSSLARPLRGQNGGRDGTGGDT